MLLDIVKKGSTDRSVTLAIIDSTDGTPETGVVFNTSGIDLWYRREGAAVTSITEATLASLTTAHADGGFLHVSNGVYRLDLPDAAFATGANHVDIGGTVTGMIVIGGRVRLVDYDPEDTVRLGLTALPNAAADAAGGLPISDAGGLDLDNRMPSATSTTNLNTVFATDFTANYNTTNDAWVVKLGDYAHGGTSANTTLGTLTVGGTTSLAAVTTSGTVTFSALTVTNALTVSGANAIPWNAAWDAEVQSECADALAAYAPYTGTPPTAAAIRAEIDSNSTGLAAIYAGVLDVPTNAELTAALAGADDAVLAAIAALNNPSASAVATAVLTTAMTEAYRSAGATATLAQFAYEVLAHLGDSSISGTTKTLKKLDGTSAKTFTLDSATTPTSITEAT